MSTELVRIEPAFEAELFDAHAEAGDVDYVDVLPDGDIVVATPLRRADEAALEAGIASVFESIVTGEAADVPDSTGALLAELNRLWAAPLAA